MKNSAAVSQQYSLRQTYVRPAFKYSTAHLRPPTNMFGCNNTKYTYCI